MGKGREWVRQVRVGEAGKRWRRSEADRVGEYLR